LIMRKIHICFFIIPQTAEILNNLGSVKRAEGDYK